MLKRYKNSYLSYIFLYVGFYLAFAAYSSVLSVYLKGMGKSDSEMSLVLSAAGIFSLVTGPILGYINDRAQNRRLVALSLLLAAAGLSLAFSAVDGLGALFALNGLVMSAFNSLSSICERLAGEGRFRYGALRVWGTAGFAAGAQGAGLFMEHLPGWGLFALAAGACMLSLAGFLGVDLPGAGRVGSQHKVKLSALWESRQFLLFLGIAFIFYGCAGVNMNYAPVLLSSLGIPAGAVGTVLSVGTLVEIPLILFSNRFMDRLSGKVLLGACFLLSFIQYVVYWLSPWAFLAVGAVVLLKALSTTLYMMTSLKTVRSLLPGELTTTGLAVVGAVNNLGVILLQNLCGYVSGGWGLQSMYLMLSVLCLLGAALLAFLRPDRGENVFT